VVILPISDQHTIALKLELSVPATAERVLQALGAWGMHIRQLCILVCLKLKAITSSLSSTPVGRQGRRRKEEKENFLAPLAEKQRQSIFYKRVVRCQAGAWYFSVPVSYLLLEELIVCFIRQ
jgi:hypothetical protein